jgi:TorA maturation chaperone TorD
MPVTFTPTAGAPVRNIVVEAPLAPHEQGRADWYALLGALLLRAPQPALLEAIAAAPAVDGAVSREAALVRAWSTLAAAAGAIDPRDAGDEYAALFEDPAGARVNPYASLYRTGFLMEAPLAELRADLRTLGLVRRRRAAETEDHLGALCEVMRVLIAGMPGVARQPVSRQKAFFEHHLGPWYGACLADLRKADGADFYVHVANLAQAFFDVEAAAFAIEDPEPDPHTLASAAAAVTTLVPEVNA